MLEQYAIVPYQAQDQQQTPRLMRDPRLEADRYGQHLLRLLEPLVRELDATMDKRPVCTLIQAVEAIVTLRDRANGLLLSQLGDCMDGLGGGGGTKRLSTLIHHHGWKAEQIDTFLLTRAEAQLMQWEARGEEALLIWDSTVLEQPESLHAEGLCAVRSSKAARLTRIKPGYYTPPGRPICVPGWHGIGLLLAGRAVEQGPALLLGMQWWTSRGAMASYEKDENCQLLRQLSPRLGRRVLHVFDRGYCSSGWLGALRGFDARFVLRWKTHSHVVDAGGLKQAGWKLGRGKRGLAPRTIFDAVHQRNVEGSVLFFPVTHPDFPDWPLTLVVGRRKGQSPWYLLTNEPVQTAEDAWRVVLAYARRWQIEQAFRNLKSELAMQSLRVYDWEGRRKLLGLLTLAYAYLMDLLRLVPRHARDWLFGYACRRTGTHLQDVTLPFTRLRMALSRLWLAFPCWFVRRKAMRL